MNLDLVGFASSGRLMNWSVHKFFSLLVAPYPPPAAMKARTANAVSTTAVTCGNLKRENREGRIEEIVMETVPVASSTQSPSSRVE